MSPRKVPKQILIFSDTSLPSRTANHSAIMFLQPLWVETASILIYRIQQHQIINLKDPHHLPILQNTIQVIIHQQKITLRMMLFMNNIDPDSKVQRPLLAHNQWFGYRLLKSLTPNHRINLLRVRDQPSLLQLFPESHTLQAKQIIRHNHPVNILSKAVLNHTILKPRVTLLLAPKKSAQTASTWIW